MAARDIGRAVVDLVKPDGTNILGTAAQTITNIGTVARSTGLSLPKATDLLKNGASSILNNPAQIMPTSGKNLPNLVPNPLEQFASYSTLWTLACLTPEQFNNPSSYRNNPSELKNVVFSSGGRFDSQRTNTFYGTPEYFVNNFQMNCLIGTNEKSGNSNAIKFSFDIFEPYSMGLLLQSMQNAAINAGYLSYLDNTPYVLRMDIQGYDELGVVIKSIKPKFFTLKLTSMKFSVNEGGSSYKVEAIPYNHQGFSSAINTAYNDLKIVGDSGGKGNVVELLSTGKNSLVSVLNRNEEKLVKEQKIGVPDEYAIQFPILSTDWYSSAGNPSQNNKATQAIDAAVRKALTGKSSAPVDATTVPINAIGNSSLGIDQLTGGNSPFKRAGDQYDAKTGVVKRDGMTIDPKNRAFQFGQGQSLTSMINQIILSSEYAKNAINEKPSAEGYIKWFKLDVQIELLKYDPIIGDYAKRITYRVVPYLVHQSIFANPSSAPVGYSELMKKICKEYNYIYTGQNVDVLRFDININNLFFNAANPSPENEGAQTSNQDQKFGEKLNKTTKAGKGAAPAAQGAQSGRARNKRSPELLAGYKGGKGDKSTEQNVAENFQRAFLSGNSADLITVDLEILGDTYWLVDSGMGNYFAKVPSENSLITNDGSMNYESGNVYVYLTFKTPVDINETTGLYDFSVAGKESPFGGIYRVNMCENTFVDGQFKQKLKLLRMPGPQGPETTNKAAGKEKLTVSKTNNSATEVTDQETPKSSPIQDTNSSTTSLAPAVRPGASGTSAEPTKVAPPPPPSSPPVPVYVLQRQSLKLLDAQNARLDIYKADRTAANWAAYQEAKAATDKFDRENNLL
jgi:hypothetical protein